jgi:beta-glucosidase
MNSIFKNILVSVLLIAGGTFAYGAAPAAASLNGSSNIPIYLDNSQPIEKRVEDALSRMNLDEKIAVIHAQSKFSAAGVKRLGLPDFWTDDGPHGVRPDVLWDEWEQAGQTNDSCVAFPALTCLTATWNPSLSLLYGQSLGEEALYRGKDMILGPGVNIYRTPLNGRNFEYMGEDPWLASTMVVPYIIGLQQNGVAACVKHYALNNDEEYRHQVNVKVSDRALHEIYLPAFKAAVQKGHTWGIMGAYNMYNNQHNCHNEILLNRILKQDWKFDGVVVSDWGGAHNTEEAITNGLDMEFGTWTDGLQHGTSNAYDNYYLATPYKKLILEGKYTEKELNDKVRRVLRLYFRTTMAPKANRGFLCSESHYEAARKIATEGIVLLQNKNNVLPISSISSKNGTPKLLVVGENAIKMMTVGGGSSSLKVQREVSPLDGLKARLGNTMQIFYERGYVGDTTGDYNGVTTGQDLTESRSEQQLIDDAVAKAKEADYVVVFGGLNKSDYQDCEGHDRKSYDLPYAQDKLVEALAKVNRNLVFVNISGNAVAMPWKDKVPAIVQGWFIGSEAGNALADVLVGDVNPSGKLPFTWPAKLNDVGAHALNTYPGTWRENEKIIDEEYKEGIYVGYRWVDKAKTKPLFAFGHGLSYTTFKLSDLRLDKSEMTADDSLRVTVTVKNTGKRAGKEVVQLYVNDNEASVDRPMKELKGSAKVALEPGQQQDVTITIGKDALSFYDEMAQKWTCEPGKFTILVGNSSDNLKLKKQFTLM